eukprot:1160858-Pelagomonas_calceolata.AAC.6
MSLISLLADIALKSEYSPHKLESLIAKQRQSSQESGGRSPEIRSQCRVDEQLQPACLVGFCPRDLATIRHAAHFWHSTWFQAVFGNKASSSKTSTRPTSGEEQHAPGWYQHARPQESKIFASAFGKTSAKLGPIRRVFVCSLMIFLTFTYIQVTAPPRYTWAHAWSCSKGPGGGRHTLSSSAFSYPWSRLGLVNKSHD